jgi:hypothetical protein
MSLFFVVVLVLQFRNDGEVFLYDLGSTHGSSINKTQAYSRPICLTLDRTECFQFIQDLAYVCLKIIIS